MWNRFEKIYLITLFTAAIILLAYIVIDVRSTTICVNTSTHSNDESILYNDSDNLLDYLIVEKEGIVHTTRKCPTLYMKKTSAVYRSIDEIKDNNGCVFCPTCVNYKRAVKIDNIASKNYWEQYRRKE